MREQTIDRSIHQVTTYQNIDSFCAADKIPAGILSIAEGGIPLDLLHSPKMSDVTIVFLHGAIETTFSLPVLSGLGISGGIEANRIFVSDPSLYLSDELTLAWYAGNSRQDTQSVLGRAIHKILESTGSSKVVFFGGSGGGFASLELASRFAGSAAIVFNPQTNLRRYNNFAVHNFTKHCYGVDPSEYDPLSLLPAEVITDVCPVYAKTLDVTVGYMQNLRDKAHVDRHMGPFVDALHPSNNVFVLTDSWEDGHKPPPKTLLTEVLSSVARIKEIGHSLEESLIAAGFENLR